VHHRGSAVILPAFDDGNDPLVRQLSHPAVLISWNAGRHTATTKSRRRRGARIVEELGLVAGKLEKLSEFFVSPGFCEEKDVAYLAPILRKRRNAWMTTKMIEVVRLPIERALQMITEGEIEDAKTIIGLILGCAAHRAFGLRAGLSGGWCSEPRAHGSVSVWG